MLSVRMTIRLKTSRITDEEILTLLTCANKGTKRFVCRCIPVKEAGDVDE